MLDKRTAFQLAKICGKFGSVHDGEILSAAKMAQRIITRIGLTWDDVLGGNSSRPKPVGLTAEILDCLKHPHLLNEREIAFLQSILTWIQGGKRLTKKQQAWFNAIRLKVELEI